MRTLLRAAGMLGCFVVMVSQSEALEIRSATTLWNIREPARVNNPECGADGSQLTAGDLILKVGAAAIDAYTGSSVASNILERLDENTKNWLKVRIGAHGGKASCSTQCVAFRNGPARLEACLVEDNGAGLQCTQAAADYSWGRVENFTTAVTDSGKTKVFCAHGKNWSEDRNRFFYVSAHY